jgi:hypothetical protein
VAGGPEIIFFKTSKKQKSLPHSLYLQNCGVFSCKSRLMKALLERAGLVAIANEHAFTGKIGAAVVAVRRGGATHAFDSINHMFQMSRMIIPGSTYWNMSVGRAKKKSGMRRKEWRICAILAR